MKSAKGSALAVVAAVLEVFTDRPQELYWCIDSQQHFGLPTLSPVGPPAWIDLLKRSRDAFDRLPTSTASCHLGMALRTRVGRAYPNGCDFCRARHTENDEGVPCPQCAPLVQVTFRLPYAANLPVLCGRAPSIGVWRLWPDPDPVFGRGSPHHQVPAEFFEGLSAGIPF